MTEHQYATRVSWAFDGVPPMTYRNYSRDFTIGTRGKPEIDGSSDPTFRGDAARYNPEELLVASLSSCHMLWYLHLCAVNGVTVIDYRDDATGTLEENGAASGQFVRVELRPTVRISETDDVAKARSLHDEAHRLCFVARSVNFAIDVRADVSS